MEASKIVGGALLVAGTAAIWFWPKAEAPAAADEAVRPVRSACVTRVSDVKDMVFSGRIKAAESRTMRFKQSGRIKRIPVSNAQRVLKGEKLAWLDPLDFENDLAKAVAAEKRDRLTFERKSDAAKKNAVSQEEVSQAEAQLRQAEAQLALAKRALEETVLYAPFDGVVADVPASELDLTGPGNDVVIVQDLSRVKVDVPIPESVVLVAQRIRTKEGVTNDCAGVSISLDSVPGRSFPATFREYVATADSRTQTYLATYEMAYPDDLLLLPGMSATLTVAGSYYEMDDTPADAVSVPSSAVGVDAAGGRFVWKLVPEGTEGLYRATRQPLTDVQGVGERVLVRDGLAVGDRVATAGVAVLTEGRKVTLLEESAR